MERKRDCIETYVEPPDEDTAPENASDNIYTVGIYVSSNLTHPRC